MNTAASLSANAPTTLIHSGALPWDSGRESRRRFRNLVLQILIGSMALLFLINQWVPYPEKNRQLAEKLPARMARVILEEKQQELLAQPIELQQETPEPEVIAEAEPEPVAEIEPEPVVQASAAPQPERVIEQSSATAQASEVQIQQAREVASSKGVLALSNQLSSLTTLAPGRNTSGTLRSTSTTAATGSAGSAIDNTATAATGGIQTTQVKAPEAKALTQRDTSIKTSDDKAFQVASSQSSDIRTAEELQLIFDQNKAAFFSLYKRALRKTLGLQGRIEFTLVVLADGSVAECEVKSSELNEPDLEDRLVARILTMNFGPKNVERWEFDYHIDFAPAG